jgi:hypothetical protein
MIRLEDFHITPRILAAAALLAMLPSAHGWAAAETPPLNGSASPLREVTVTAHRLELEGRVSSFITQIAATENGNEGLARWEVPPVCPLVSGLPRQDGEYILERLTQIAIGAGVPLADENCRPNLYILVTGQPENLLRGMEKRNRRFTFGYNPASRAETPASVVDEFIKTPHVVKVWYNSAEKDAWGQALSYCPAADIAAIECAGIGSVNFNPSSSTMGLRTSTPSASIGPTISSGSMGPMGAPASIQSGCGAPHFDPGQVYQCQRAVSTHISFNNMWWLSRVFVVVDQKQLHHVKLRQLAEYVAMSGFAKLKPSARLGDAPTILTLFSGAPEAAPTGLTGWDKAFLKSLYATEQKSKQQRSQIARRMVRDLAP